MKTSCEFKYKRAFSSVEILVALGVITLGMVISVISFRSIEKASSKTKDLIQLANLESRVQLAVEDIRNYVPYRPILNNGGPQLPSEMSFKFYQGSTPILMGVFSSTNNVPLFFNKKLEACLNIVAATPDCPYKSTIEVAWVAGELQVKATVEKARGLNSEENVFANFSDLNNAFIVPHGFYKDTQNLKCPNIPGKTFIGIQRFDTTLGTTECWEMKNTACPEGQFPQGLKVDTTASSPTYELDCKAFFKFQCDEGFAPKTFFPLNPETEDSDPSTSLVNACVNLKKTKVGPPRLGHIENSITQAKALGKYGLRWVNARVCPAGYSPQNSNPSPLIFEDEFVKALSIGDAINKEAADCSTVKAKCTSYFLDSTLDPQKDEPSFACDLCPRSSLTAEGCTNRNFPHPYDSASANVSPTCADPNIISINKSALQNNFECILLESEFSNGT